MIGVHARDTGDDLGHVIHEGRVHGDPCTADKLAPVAEVLAELPDDVGGILVAVAKEHAKVEVLRRVIHWAADGYVLHRASKVDVPRKGIKENHEACICE